MRMMKKDVPAEYRALIQRFRLIDDTFFNVCFDNYIEGMQLLLRLFFGRDDLVVRHVVTQQSADNLYGRGVRFDVLAEDSEGRLYDCEVQRANEGAAPRRARYNSSMMDSRELAKGAEFSGLPETWVIFITEICMERDSRCTMWSESCRKSSDRLEMERTSSTSMERSVTTRRLGG